MPYLVLNLSRMAYATYKTFRWHNCYLHALIRFKLSKQSLNARRRKTDQGHCSYISLHSGSDVVRFRRGCHQTVYFVKFSLGKITVLANGNV